MIWNVFVDLETHVDSINFGLGWEICKTKEEGRIWYDGKEKQRRGKTKSEEKKEEEKRIWKKLRKYKI